MIRNVFLVVSAISSAVAFGRKMADETIEKKLADEIEVAKALAIEEVDREIGAEVEKRLGVFALTLGLKATLVGGAYMIYALGWSDLTGFRMMVAGLLAAFIGHDVVRASPSLPAIWRFLRRYGLNIKAAITEYTARATFDRAYRATMEKLETGTAKGVVTISTYSPQELSHQVAEAVADVAASVSYDRAKAHAGVAAAKAGGMFILYCGFVALAIWA